MKYIVSCFQCKKEFIDQWWLCPECGGSLEVEYSQVVSEPQFPIGKILENTLGEGNTPLVRLTKFSQQLGCELWAKCESQNPTGSFKDRGSVIEIAKALELEKKGVVCASTGNMAASLSAYAARFNLECKVVIPALTPESKLQQATACGATLVKVDGTYDECVGVAQTIAEEENFFLCGDYLLRREGQKTIGWELAKNNFDSFVVPVGNGNVGIAIAQAFMEARCLRQPKFIGVQAETVNPVEKAWRTSQPILPLKNTKTIASAFNVGNPLDGQLTLDWVKKNNGKLIVVSDAEILAAQELLAKQEGLYIESTAATSLAGLLKIQETLKNQKIVLILTGSGLKERG